MAQGVGFLPPHGRPGLSTSFLALGPTSLRSPHLNSRLYGHLGSKPEDGLVLLTGSFYFQVVNVTLALQRKISFRQSSWPFVDVVYTSLICLLE